MNPAVIDDEQISNSQNANVSETLSSALCITNSNKFEDSNPMVTRNEASAMVNHPDQDMDDNDDELSSHDLHELDQDDCSVDIKKKKPKISNTGRWVREEHERFLQAMRIYGKDWDAIEEYVGTRDTTHCRSHAQKFFRKLLKYQKLNIDEKKQEGIIKDAEIYLKILQKRIKHPVRK